MVGKWLIHKNTSSLHSSREGDFRIGYIFLFHRLKFPTSLVLYQTCSVLVVGVIILVGFVDRKSLFCSSKDVLDNFNNPTAFCSITGKITVIRFSYQYSGMRKTPASINQYLKGFSCLSVCQCVTDMIHFRWVVLLEASGRF